MKQRNRISSDSSLCETTKKRLINRQMTKQDINSNNITVTVTKSVIYLLGSNAGSQQAIEEVMTSMKNFGGVTKIVNLIDQ